MMALGPFPQPLDDIVWGVLDREIDRHGSRSPPRWNLSSRPKPGHTPQNMKRLVGKRPANQAAAIARCRAIRIAAPSMPTPISINVQDAGSGAPLVTVILA